MAKARASIPNKLRPWIEARKRFHLSHAHIQMARELGLNPQKLGGIDNQRQEPWKQPLSEFIATLYEKRFGIRTPVGVQTIEETVAAKQQKKQQRRARRAATAAEGPADAGAAAPADEAPKAKPVCRLQAEMPHAAVIPAAAETQPATGSPPSRG